MTGTPFKKLPFLCNRITHRKGSFCPTKRYVTWRIGQQKRIAPWFQMKP